MKKNYRYVLIKLGGNCLKINLLIFCFLGACTSPVKQASISIMEQKFDSIFVDSTVSKIWEILNQEFPQDSYIYNVSLDELKQQLPGAITSRQPYIVTFAPIYAIKGIDQWYWTTSFWELAGQYVTITHYTPSYHKYNGEIFQLDTDDGGEPLSIKIDPYSKGSYEHVFINPSLNFSGSYVVLEFEIPGYENKKYNSSQNLGLQLFSAKNTVISITQLK